MQKVPGHTVLRRRAPSACRQSRFQVLFHSPSGVLFTFPSRYLFTIGRWVVFRLGGWSRQIPAGLHVSCGTQVSARLSRTTTTGLSPSLARRSKRFVSSSRMPHRRPYNPRCITTSGLAFVPVRSPLLGESRLFSFPPGTEMFHFPGFAHSSLCIQPERTRRSRVGWVAPFGDPGITACERLPLAYRSCPRPS